MTKYLNSARPYIQKFLLLIAFLSAVYVLAGLFDPSLLEIPLQIVAIYLGTISFFTVFCGWALNFFGIPKMSWRHYIGLALAWLALIFLVVGIAELFKN